MVEIHGEIHFMSQLGDCPYVPAYHGSFIFHNKLWIIMEFCGGGSCVDMVLDTDQKLKSGPFDESHICTILKEVLQGLAFLHSQAKLHRDIKGANVLLVRWIITKVRRR
jgi:serine/threonine-protein kinase 24/25/MST4